MANDKAPFDAKIAAENAAIVEEMSKLPWAAFGAGTDKGETRAKPEIWSDGAKFKKSSDDLVAAAAPAERCRQDRQSGQPEEGVWCETAKTCKACHDAFRKE